MSSKVRSMKTEKVDFAGRYLTFTLGEDTYGLELMDVIDIITMQNITTIPHVPPYVRGVINLRGKIIPVVDIRMKFGLPCVDYDDRTCIIVVKLDNVEAGMIVDRVSEVVTFTPDDLSLIPNFDKYNSNKYLSSIGRAGNNLVLNLDCRKIFDYIGD